MEISDFKFQISFFAFIALLASFVSAAEPATQPASNPALNASIAKSFSDLADSDTTVREGARIHLLALDRSALPALRDIVDASRPLLPSQSAVLHDIVSHVYLASEAYESNPAEGFLGLRWQDGSDEDDVTSGVPVAERIPGFCAYRALLEGDLILHIIEHPELKFVLRGDFTEKIKSMPARAKIHLEVNRQGRILQVPITLDARPSSAANRAAIEELLGHRQQLAEEYWRKTFAPLLDGGVS